ncbi:RNA 3'-terminal phosphate cyclase [Halomicroarcula sp. GCM10025324]|uniref:RNA 3'-terminal phosphate cyclase n=1 Tax=Haloarcula TaxID=2237 RepID=UPI0023E8E999|nr:RNA 3'-terminal phosphate cyclase [Halomicroarcula sp. ZS-22-S1]
MITIDGTDGGGQLLRTALSLSVVTDTPFRMESIRGARPNPGLGPQHLTAVDVTAELCEAEVTGAEPGSETLTFRPGRDRRSGLAADIGTAGSVTLLFDTILPIATTAETPVLLLASGGTDVKWAPTIAYHQRVKLPLLSTWGLDADIDLLETGFFPAGGGQAVLRTKPATLAPIELDRRGDLERVDIYSKAAETLEAREVADRQAQHALDELEALGFSAEVRQVSYPETLSTGSSLLLRGVYERSLTGVDALGERGRTSEAVAAGAVERFLTVHERGAPVDPFMADQVLVFLALAGGRVRIPRVTDHVRTNLDLLTAFGSDIELAEEPDGCASLTASPIQQSSESGR